MPSESRTVSIVYPVNDLSSFGVKSGRNLSSLRCCRRCGGWVLGIVVADECPGNIDRVRGVENSFDLAGVDHQRNASRLGKSIQCLAHVILKRCKNLLTAALISSLAVLAAPLVVFPHLIELFDFGLNGFWIDGSGRLLQLLHFILESLNSFCGLIQIVLRLLELTVQFILQNREPGDSLFWVLKRGRENYCYLTGGNIRLCR